MPRSVLWMPKISRHSYDIAVVAVRRDHTSCVSVLIVYRPWLDLRNYFRFGSKRITSSCLITSNKKSWIIYFFILITIICLFFILKPKLVLSRSKQPVNFVKICFGLVVECHEFIRNSEITEPQLFTLGWKVNEQFFH